MMITTFCDDSEMQELVQAMQTGGSDDLQQADRLLTEYPEDPRLHFLRGSILASIGRPIEALPALERAVELAPDFAIARFQLGFFQLTSGEAAQALSTWGPLALLPEEHYLRKFIAGLTYLIRDEFDEALAQLKAGIAANSENAPLNRDMQLIADKAAELLAQAGSPASPGQEDASSTSFLLDQFSTRGRSH